MRSGQARMCTHTIVLIIHFMYYIAIITHKQSVLFKNIVYLCINIQNYIAQENRHNRIYVWTSYI